MDTCCCGTNCGHVKLTGTYQRPVKQKMKHRKLLPLAFTKAGFSYKIPDECPDSVQIYAEWEE
jgi:hypothetical protein